MSHRLDPLLRPRSIAVLGASEREGSVGRRLVHNLLAGGFEGNLYPVNPGRDSVLDLSCYPNLDSLPEQVDHVVFAVSDYRIEAALEDAIAHGARSATIMSQLLIEEEGDRRLHDLVRDRISASDMLVCGPNGMGFYNCRDGVWMCGFDTRENHVRGGNVTLLSHSGSVMASIADSDERVDFNLTVSTGEEFNVGMHDYMDFALEVHDTRVIGLFMETIRCPDAMLEVLAKANHRRVPVVAIKVGRTELSAKLAQSHSGAMAGEDSAYEALFDRYGVQRVHDLDALATALIMFAQPHPVGEGGLVALHDSGGERQLLIDLAEEMGTPLTEVSPDTVRKLEAILDPGLPAINPLDAWGAGGNNSDQIMRDCMAALMCDPQAALGVVNQARAPHSAIYPVVIEYVRAGHAASGKPVFLVANRQGTGSDPLVVEATRDGLPVIDGLRSFLSGVNALFGHRDFHRRPAPDLPQVDGALIDEARTRLAGKGALGEAASMALLGLLGLPANKASIASTEANARSVAEEMGFPVVMKTAEPGIQHKTEHQGVHLGLQNPDLVGQAYRDLSGRIGPDVLLAPMVEDGLEMALGMVRDDQFGPLIMLGFGGIRLEALRDVVYAMPPFDAETAKRLCGKLRQQTLLKFDRGGGRPDLDSFYTAAALFSVLVALLGDAIEEIDINPLVLNADGCVAVDALVIGTDKAGDDLESRKAS